MRVLSQSLICASIGVVCMTGCVGQQVGLQVANIDSGTILAKCREKWNWTKTETAFGRPTVAVLRMQGEAMRHFLPQSQAYRVTVVNRSFVFGSGSVTQTYACLVQGAELKFLENDDDAETALIHANSKSVVEALQLLEVFSELRGYKLQVGVPSKTNAWVVVPADGIYPSLIAPDENDPSKWNLLISRQTNIWDIECTLVAVDDFRAYRYRVAVATNGAPVFKRESLVFSPGTSG